MATTFLPHMRDYPYLHDTSDTATVGPRSNRGSKPGERRGGRVKGTPNKLTQTVKQVIEQVAAELGGAQRMVQWAREAADNERLFWSQMYLKLMPKEIKVEHSGEISPASPVLVVPAPLTFEAWSEAMAIYQASTTSPVASDADTSTKTALQ